MTPPRPAILDCDPGIDDCVAILLALASPEVDLRGITTVAGNTSLANATANALAILDWTGRPDLPVAAGAAVGIGPASGAEWGIAGEMHGPTGIEGAALPLSARVADDDAVALLAETVLAAPGQVTIVATGPLTNVAHLLDRHPEAGSALRELVVMGGSLIGGNITDWAEFNVWCDPVATARVLEHGLDPLFVGLDVTTRATLSREDVHDLLALPVLGPDLHGMLLHYLAKHVEWHGVDVVHQHDPLALSWLIDPTLLDVRPVHLAVATEGERAGCTTVAADGAPNARWAHGVRGDAFRTLLLERLGALAASL